MAAGKPILCDFPSRNNPVIRWNAGLDLEDASPESIAKAVEEIAQMESEKLEQYGKNARKAAEQVFDFEVIAVNLRSA